MPAGVAVCKVAGEELDELLSVSVLAVMGRVSEICLLYMCCMFCLQCRIIVALLMFCR